MAKTKDKIKIRKDKIKIKIDKEKCIGCGTCAVIAPEIFELGEDNKAHTKVDAKIDKELAKQAAESCPVGAIIIEIEEE